MAYHYSIASTDDHIHSIRQSTRELLGDKSEQPTVHVRSTSPLLQHHHQETDTRLHHPETDNMGLEEYKRKYYMLLEKFSELQQDQSETMVMHAEAVIELQDKVREKEKKIKKLSCASTGEKTCASTGDGSGSLTSGRERSDRDTIRNQGSPPDYQELFRKEQAKHKEDLEKKNQKIEELEKQVGMLTVRLNDTLQATATSFETYLQTLTKKVAKSEIKYVKTIKELQVQCQEIREKYVEQSRVNAEKSEKIVNLERSVWKKSREIEELREWLGKVKAEMRRQEIKKVKAMSQPAAASPSLASGGIKA